MVVEDMRPKGMSSPTWEPASKVLGLVVVDKGPEAQEFSTAPLHGAIASYLQQHERQSLRDQRHPIPGEHLPLCDAPQSFVRCAPGLWKSANSKPYQRTSPLQAPGQMLVPLTLMSLQQNLRLWQEMQVLEILELVEQPLG